MDDSLPFPAQGSPATKPRGEEIPSRSVGIWVGLVCYYALVLPYFSYVPIWDSMENLEEYLFHPRTHFTLDTFLLMHNGHPSFGYFWPFWIAQGLFPSQMLPVHIINVAIGSLAVIAFGKVATIAFEGLAGKLEIALLTVCFAIHPIFVAYAINMSPDYGVLAYFLATLWAFYAGRLGWVAVTGTLLIFSKETGLLLYLLLLIFYLSGLIRKYRWQDLWPFAIPLMGFGLYCLHQKLNQHAIFPWATNYLAKESLWSLYLPNPLKGDFKMACLGPFVFEFQWVFTIVILAGVLHALVVKRPAGPGWREVRSWFQGIHPPLRCFIFLAMGCLYIVSRTVIFTNQRYFITLYPLVLLLFLAALVELNVRRQVRLAMLLGALLLLFPCNFRTLDPVSKQIAGTISFGEHPLLSIATIRPDFGAINRDEWVYNLEHTYLPYLLDDAFREIRPTNHTVFIIPSYSWWLMARLDARTYRRTESTRPPVINLRVQCPIDIMASHEKPETLFVVILPYLQNDKELDLLTPLYQPAKDYLFRRNGYELRIVEMTRKPTSMANAK